VSSVSIKNLTLLVVDEAGQMILSGADGFQTVRIMPTETNPGEVSYVLIVQQPDDEKDKDNQEDPDYTVYDFDEAEDNEPVSGMVRNLIRLFSLLPYLQLLLFLRFLLCFLEIPGSSQMVYIIIFLLSILLFIIFKIEKILIS
jgi:hypothetical protein